MHVYCILTCCLLLRKLLHNWEDYDSSSSTWTLNSYLDKYRGLEACQGKNIMICRNCNAAVSDASLAVLGHYHYRIWCFGRGSFVRIPEVRQIVTSVDSTLRLRALVVFLHCVRLCQTDIQEMSLLRRMFLQKEGDILYPWAHSGERANDEIQTTTFVSTKPERDLLGIFCKPAKECNWSDSIHVSICANPVQLTAVLVWWLRANSGDPPAWPACSAIWQIMCLVLISTLNWILFAGCAQQESDTNITFTACGTAASTMKVTYVPWAYEVTRYSLRSVCVLPVCFSVMTQIIDLWNIIIFEDICALLYLALVSINCHGDSGYAQL